MRRVLVGAVLLCAPGPSLRGQDAEHARCLARAYASYAEAQQAYQHELHRLLVERAPTLRPLAESALREQLSLRAARQHAFLATLHGNGSALRTDRSVNQWLDWGATQRDSLRRVDAEYARLVAESERWRARTSGDPNWAALRRVLREEVVPSDAHQRALDRLRRAMDAASAACPR